jgi:2-polyprenyl-3-methyl-5-hydroxy-6-metoxy-1,4-benzoquinol methylase
MLYDIRDHEWFALQSNPAIALEKYGLQIPILPSAEIQRSFTALDGHHNLLQAFEFYRHVCAVCGISELEMPRILDFGGGWGRVSRFFLRNTLPQHIYIADTMQHAIDCLQRSGCQYSVIHNQPQPPMEWLPGSLDLVVSYSVFSHLSERYFLDWVSYLLGQLRPGGHLAFTTRGTLFINHLKHLHATGEPASSPPEASHMPEVTPANE